MALAVLFAGLSEMVTTSVTKSDAVDASKRGKTSSYRLTRMGDHEACEINESKDTISGRVEILPTMKMPGGDELF